MTAGQLPTEREPSPFATPPPGARPSDARRIVIAVTAFISALGCQAHPATPLRSPQGAGYQTTGNNSPVVVAQGDAHVVYQQQDSSYRDFAGQDCVAAGGEREDLVFVDPEKPIQLQVRLLPGDKIHVYTAEIEAVRVGGQWERSSPDTENIVMGPVGTFVFPDFSPSPRYPFKLKVAYRCNLATSRAIRR
jgi:hypothetical protein